MNRRLVFWSAFAAILMASVMAYGQRQGQGQGQGRGRMMGGGMFGRGMTLARLVGAEAVQKEVSITEEQKTKLQELVGSGRQGMANFRDMSQEERAKAMEEFRKTAAEQEKKIAALLTDKQAKRVEEIRVQALGINAVMDEAIAKKLEITDAQKEKIEKANTAYREKMQEAMSGGGGFDREASAKMRTDMEDALKKTLTEKQVAKLEELKGKAFDLTQIRGGRGGRGGGQGRGN